MNRQSSHHKTSKRLYLLRSAITRYPEYTERQHVTTSEGDISFFVLALVDVSVMQ